MSQEELFRESDVLSLHCPLTPETTGLVNRKTLSLMKPTAYLINTSRGQVIREQDLAAVSYTHLHAFVQDQVGRVFSAILENSGVYKTDETGRKAFLRFIGAVNGK